MEHADFAALIYGLFILYALFNGEVVAALSAVILFTLHHSTT